jgi:hypothetical protein
VPACAMQVPIRFKVYGKPQAEGGFDVKLGKKPQGSLTQAGVEKAARRLRSSLDVPSFARSPRWEDFRADADQLHEVLMAKITEMKAAASGEAERRNDTQPKSAKPKARLVPPSLSGTPAKYATLEGLLRQMADYSVLTLSEELCLELHPLSAEALAGKDPDGARRKHVERWREGIAFQSFAVEVYTADWGSDRKICLFVWRVPIDAASREMPWSVTLQAQAFAAAEKQIPIIHGRYARQAFTQKFANITGISSAMLGNMYDLLTSDTQATQNTAQKAIQMRCVEFVASCGDVELWPDLRALNGNDGSKYDLFWEAGDKLLEELESQASANRHGQERTLAQPVSVPDFTRQVEQRLRDAGHTDAPIPDPHWVAFQFHPRRPTDGVARRYTGRWAIKMQVLQTTLRKKHPDGHWCNALERNNKGFIREFDERLVKDLTDLSDLRAKMAALLEEMSRLKGYPSAAIDDPTDHNPSERKAELLAVELGHWARLAFPDRAIANEDLKGWLAGASSTRIGRFSDDTKCKVPVGEPDARVSSSVRPSG